MSARVRARSDDGGEIPRIPLLFVTPEESIISPIDRRSQYYRQAARTAGHPKPVPQPLMTVPNVMTFIRLLLVPVLLLVWESSWKYSNITCAVIFIIASITDWADGYIARRYQIATVFGAFLDPVADKIMVAAALIMLTTSPPPPLHFKYMSLPVILIICREITMSALREWAASAGGAAQKAVKVNSLGKWKTALQMTAMSILLVVRQPLADFTFLPPHVAGSDLFLWLAQIAFVLLWGGTALAVWSLVIYFSNVWTHFVYPVAKEGKAQ